MSNIKLAGMVTLYKPSKENISNIKNYIDSIERLYVFDNTDNVDNSNMLPKDKKIVYITKKENKGIAYSMNECANRAIEDGYTHLLTMDQDSKMTSDIINKMLEFLRATKISKIGLISPYQDIGLGDKIPDNEYDDIIEIMTSGNIIDLKVFKKIGGFKSWLFIDCVDTDYCMNLHRHGYKVLRLNKIVMKHELGNQEMHYLLGKRYECSNHNAMRRYYIARNNMYIHDMYYDLYPEYCDRLIRIQKGQAKRILAFEKDKFNKLKMMFKGYRDYKKGIKGKLK